MTQREWLMRLLHDILRKLLISVKHRTTYSSVAMWTFTPISRIALRHIFECQFADQEEYGFGLVRRAGHSCILGHAFVLSSLAKLQQQQGPEEGSYKIALRWQKNRRPFLGVKGYVGQAPDHVEEGDIAVIFLGAKFPYILRKLEDDIYRFIGEAYVHGIMYGEFFTRHEPHMEEFILR